MLWLILLLIWILESVKAEPFYIQEMIYEKEVKTPVRFVNYGIAKSDLDNDLNYTETWIKLIETVIKGEVQSIMTAQETDINPNEIKSRKVYGMKGPLNSVTADYEKSYESTCYNTGFMHPEPLHKADIVEIRSLGKEDGRDKILLPTLRKQNKRLVYEHGYIIPNEVPGTGSSTEPLMLLVEDGSVINFGVKQGSTDIGNIKTYCQQINTHTVKKGIVIKKISQVLSSVQRTLNHVEVIKEELENLVMTDSVLIDSNENYEHLYSWEAYTLIQETYEVFSKHELSNQKLNSLVTLVYTYEQKIAEVRALVEKERYFYKNQGCQIKQNAEKYVLKCKQTLKTQMMRMEIVPIPFVYEQGLYQLMYDIYDKHTEYCITYSSYRKEHKEYRIYLDLQCCEEIYQKKVPKSCPLIQLKSLAMIIDIGEKEMMIPDTEGTEVEAHCQDERKSETLHTNRELKSECRLKFGGVRLPMQGSEFIWSVVKQVDEIQRIFTNRELGLIGATAATLLGCLIQCCLCYFKYVKPNRTPDNQDSSDDERETTAQNPNRNRNRLATSSIALNNLLSRRTDI